jgi:hypothetical protein
LLSEMVELLTPAQRARLGEEAARDMTALRVQLEAELRAGSKTAARMITGIFADRREGEH